MAGFNPISTKKLNADNAKGLNQLLAELAEAENNWLEAAYYWNRQAILNDKLGIPSHVAWENYRKCAAIHLAQQAFEE
jgi:hypothetical protein